MRTRRAAIRRRQTAHATVSAAMIHTGFAISWWKRSIVPVTLLPCTARGEFWAMFPAVKKLFELIPGITNQNTSSSPSAPDSQAR